MGNFRDFKSRQRDYKSGQRDFKSGKEGFQIEAGNTNRGRDYKSVQNTGTGFFLWICKIHKISKNNFFTKHLYLWTTASAIGFLTDSTKMFFQLKLLLKVTHNSYCDCELCITVFDTWKLSGFDVLKDSNVRSSHQMCSIKTIKKGVLKNFAKFTWKHMWQSLLFNKVVGWGLQLY